MRLSDRELGSEFCRLERALIFDSAYENVGYAHFHTKDSIILKRSRFTDIDRGVIYLLPPDLVKKVSEGDLIEIVPGRSMDRMRPVGEGRGRSFTRSRYVEAMDVVEGRVPVPAPNLPRDEFVQRSSSSWVDAEEDMLDMVIALLLVSAPSSVYGRGGIGSEGLEVYRERGYGTLADVAQTVRQNLPIEFRTGSNVYRYEVLDTLGSMRAFRKEKAQELSYSIIKPHRVTQTWLRDRVPVQLPFVLENARLKEQVREIDLDVLDYQLCALYSPPPDAGHVLEMAKDSVKRATASGAFDMPGPFDIDPMAGLRVALSIMRLNIGREFKGTSYIRRPLSGHEEGMRVFEKVLKRGLEEVRKRMDQEDFFRMDRSLPFRDRLTEQDRMLFYEIKKEMDEKGLEEIPKESVVKGRNRLALEGSLEKLNRYGYVLFMKGGEWIRIIDLDSL